MTYLEFLETEKKRIALEPLLQLLSGLAKRRVLVYSHDDPDGLTSALIFTRLLKKLDIPFRLLFPSTYELEKERLETDLRKESVETVFLLDKGTMGYYDEYAGLVKNFIVIDHHPLFGKK
ncbi:MAG TPA: DHH family phosphoesterase, partial [bacterium]|nr:DHH family phosphoesterase [bacterium]